MNNMTVNDVIKHVVPVLEGIKVPMSEIRTIGFPLSAAISDLKKCIEFLNKVEEEVRKEEEAAAKAQDEPADEEQEENQNGRESEQ